MCPNNPKIETHCTKEPLTVMPDISLRKSLEVMLAWKVRHLPITINGKIVGLISERDVYRALAQKSNPLQKVGEIMLTDIYKVSMTDSLGKVAEVMANNRIGCAIVTNSEGEVRGIFTTTDACWVLAEILKDPEEKKFYKMSVVHYIDSLQNRVA